MDQNRILAHIPVIGCQYILRALIENTVQSQHIAVLFFCHIKRHAISAGIQIHLMEILMYIEIGHNPAAVRIVFQVINHPVHLIHHSFLILMLYTHLVTIGFADGTAFVRPAVPDVAFQFMDVIGFLLPDPQKLIHTALNGRPPESKGRKLL